MFLLQIQYAGWFPGSLLYVPKHLNERLFHGIKPSKALSNQGDRWSLVWRRVPYTEIPRVSSHGFASSEHKEKHK